MASLYCGGESMPARFFRFAPLAVMALSSLAYSQHAFKPLPKLVVQAKYVLVTTYQGYNPASSQCDAGRSRSSCRGTKRNQEVGKIRVSLQAGGRRPHPACAQRRIVATQPQMRLGKSSTTPLEVSGAAPVNAGDARDMLAIV